MLIQIPKYYSSILAVLFIVPSAVFAHGGISSGLGAFLFILYMLAGTAAVILFFWVLLSIKIIRSNDKSLNKLTLIIFIISSLSLVAVCSYIAILLDPPLTYLIFALAIAIVARSFIVIKKTTKKSGQ